MKKDAYYFSHDANAHQDPKIMRMLLTMKAEGYGIYWVIIEMLRSEPTLTLGTKDYDAIAYLSHSDCTKVARIVNDFGLFNIKENGDFYSESLMRRVEEYRNKSKRYSENAHKRWHNDAMALQSQSNGNALKERKGKERKVKESNISNSGHNKTPLFTSLTSKANPSDKSKAFTKPTVDELSLYIAQGGFRVDAGRFLDYYDANGWVVGKNKMKDWKATVRNWHRRNQEVSPVKTGGWNDLN